MANSQSYWQAGLNAFGTFDGGGFNFGYKNKTTNVNSLHFELGNNGNLYVNSGSVINRYPMNSGSSANTLTTKTYVDNATLLSVKNFGATGDGVTDDTTAILNAVAYQQNANNAEAYVYFPAGVYNISQSITVTSSYRPLKIMGEGMQQSDINPSDLSGYNTVYGTRIRQMTDNIPVINISQSTRTPFNEILNISLGFKNTQPTASSSGVCIQTNGYYNRFENIYLDRGSTLIKFTNSATWQNIISNFRANIFSVCALDMSAIGASTTNTFTHFYIQNNDLQYYAYPITAFSLVTGSAWQGYGTQSSVYNVSQADYLLMTVTGSLPNWAIYPGSYVSLQNVSGSTNYGSGNTYASEYQVLDIVRSATSSSVKLSIPKFSVLNTPPTASLYVAGAVPATPNYNYTGSYLQLENDRVEDSVIKLGQGNYTLRGIDIEHLSCKADTLISMSTFVNQFVMTDAHFEGVHLNVDGIYSSSALIKNQAQNCVINSIEYTDAGIYPSSSHAVINNSSNGYLSDYGTRNVFVGGLAISNIGGFSGSFYIATGSSGNNPRTYIDSVTIGGNEQFLFNGGTYATDFSKRIAYYNPTSYGNAVKAKVQSTGMIDSTCGGMILNPVTGSWYRLIATTGSKGSTLTGNKGGNSGRVRIQTSAYNNDVDLEFDYSLLENSLIGFGCKNYELKTIDYSIYKVDNFSWQRDYINWQYLFL